MTPHFFSSRSFRLFAVCVLLLCGVLLAACGARPDSGSVSRTTIHEGDTFHVECSGSGVNREDLTYTIMAYLQSDHGLSMVDTVQPDTLVVRVDVREIFPHGSSRMDARETMHTTVLGVMAGAMVGSLIGGGRGALVGAGTGAVTGLGVSALDSKTKTTWALRAGVGVGRGAAPDSLDEVVVSADGISTRDEALPTLQDRLAQKISQSLDMGGPARRLPDGTSGS
ncbi:hypothetical protein [uncultured Desulfovibrio sp.]|uniref:YMGG-like glycine zipper-containing protein n=1 Tax=uncultured Desulfovibrio sp. TaxID=167968 RepID=UPI00262728F5|nr:hypothetical protein [uncultured Desulfovibrio sp.]